VLFCFTVNSRVRRESNGDDNEGFIGEENNQETAVAKVDVPEYFPDIPVIPVTRTPVFPKFVKMVEVR